MTWYLLAAFVAWSGVCVRVGQILELRARLREDLNQRDQWAEQYQKRNGVA